MRILRSLFAFAVLPGVMAGLIPWLIARGHPFAEETMFPGAILLTIGILLLALCVREFHVVGKGTLAPWDPPLHLVATGPFAIVRNPMYVAVLAIVSGWTLAFTSSSLVLYLVGLAIAFHLRVLLYEEPRAQRTFGAAWFVYQKTVPRWIPRKKH